MRLSSVVGVASRMKLTPAFSAGTHSSTSSSGGRSTTISPSTPAALASVQEPVDAVGIDRVVIAHQDDRRRGVGRAEFLHTSWIVRRSVMPDFSARSDDAWIDGPSAIGSVNGMPISITSAPAAGKPLDQLQRGGVVGIAGGDDRSPDRPALRFRPELGGQTAAVGGAAGIWSL